MKLFLARQWFLIGLALVLVLGFTCWPTLSVWSRWFPEKAVVAIVLFLTSWSLDSHAMWRALSRPAAAALGIAVNFILVPLLAWSVAHLLPLELAQGLCLAAALPCTLASAAVWTRRAGGSDAVALVVTMVTNVSCFLVTPFLLWLMTGRSADVSVGGRLPAPWDMVASLAIVVVLPMIVGQLLRIPRPLARWATANKTPLSVVCLVGILTMVLLGAVNSGRELHQPEMRAALGAYVWLLLLGCAAFVHTGALALGYLAARGIGINPSEASAVAIAGSQKTLMVGLHIALALNFGIGILPLVVYHVLQLLIDTPAADWLRRRGTSAPPIAAEDEAAAVT